MNKLPQELEQLRQELAFYKNLIAIMPGHIYWQDCNNRFLGCNLAQAKTAGLSSPEAFVNTTPYEHVPEAEAHAICELNDRVIKTGQVHIVENTGTYVDGIKRTFLDQKIPIKDDDGNVIGLLGVAHDITAEKQLGRDLQVTKRQMRDAERTLKSIIALLPGHVYWKDKTFI